MSRMLRTLALASALLGSARPAGAQARIRAAMVSLSEGTAQARRGPGIPQDLRQGSSLRPGDVVETSEDSRLELKLPDASVLRLGPQSRLELGSKGGRGPLAIRLFLGSVWAKVTAATGRAPTLRVETKNAVAEARGTTFRVDAHQDSSVLVRVYSGTVAVRRDAGEKVLGRQMQILVSADGTPGVPAPFSEADEKNDEWSAWNRKRDEQGK
jgi:ferric-dicitrate binding protein FerR (iron transport regulator)